MALSQHRLRANLACLACGLWLTLPAYAQVLSLHAGSVSTKDLEHQRSPAFALDYVAPLTERLGLGWLYLNEGHFEHHHRDGYGVQLWVRTDPLWRGVTLSAGAGPYLHFDTAARRDRDYANTHGVGMVYSLAASMPVNNRWSVQARLNRVEARNAFDTNSILLGVGYNLDGARTGTGRSASFTGGPRKQEVAVYAGRTVVNSFESQHAAAFAAEYRLILSQRLQWTVGLLNEGDTERTSRRGFTTQLWVHQSTADNKWTFAFGAGPYLAWDREVPGHADGRQRRAAGLLSLAAGYTFTPRWRARVTWNRVVSDYHRDSDVVLVGAGYSF